MNKEEFENAFKILESYFVGGGCLDVKVRDAYLLWKKDYVRLIENNFDAIKFIKEHNKNAGKLYYRYNNRYLLSEIKEELPEWKGDEKQKPEIERCIKIVIGSSDVESMKIMNTFVFMMKNTQRILL